MNTILLVVLVLFLIGALPTWPYSANWGYYPSGGLGLVLPYSADIGFKGPAFLSVGLAHSGHLEWGL